jgi:hypothetical protein
MALTVVTVVQQKSQEEKDKQNIKKHFQKKLFHLLRTEEKTGAFKQ